MAVRDQELRSRLRALGGSLRPWLLTAAFFGAGLLVAVRADYDPRSPLVSMALQVAVAALVVATAALAAVSRLGKPWAVDAVAAASAAFTGVVLSVALHGSTYAVGGLGVAAANRTPAVVRYAETWHLVDYSYKGLPAFYPPLLPWVAGRFALFTHIEPWLALKLVSIATLVLAALAGYLLWRRVLPTRLALFVPVALAALVTLAPSMLQQPDSLVALAVIVPWWIDGVFGVRRPRVRAWPFWVSGLVGALVFCTYYYYFFPLAIALLLTPLLDRMHEPAGAHPYRQRLLVVGTAAALASVYWLPFGISIIRAQAPASLQNYWFAPDMTLLHVDVFDTTPAGLVMLAGLVHLLVTRRRDRVSMSMLLLVVAGYLWYAFSAVSAIAGLPVLGFRTVPFIDLVLLIAGVRALAAFAGWATVAVRRHGHSPTAAVTVVAAAFAFTVAQGYTATTLSYSHVRQSHDTPLPDGRLQRYASPGAHRPVVSERRLETAVRDLYTGPDEPVALSSSAELLKMSGMYAFNQWHAIYAHPAGEFYARARLIERLAATPSPETFERLARDSRFDTIDAFVLLGRGRSLKYDYSDVIYPDGAKRKIVRFSRAQFSSAHWRTRQVGPYFVAVAR
jgi:galactan 5-O-arabinofuranosyltransferase